MVEIPISTPPEGNVTEAPHATYPVEKESHIEAFAFVLMEIGEIRPAYSLIQTIPQVRHVGIYTGGSWDIVARIQTRTLEEMGEIFLGQIQTIDGVVKSELDLVID